MENNLKYIVYCTTNTTNNKIYIGVHGTQNPDIFDGYIGCGVYVNNAGTYNNPKTRFEYAVKKYGPKVFIRKTLSIFDNEDDAYMLEALIVDEKFLERHDVYNMVVGGNGGRSITSIKIYKYDSEGNFIKEYPSINNAAKCYNIAMSCIWYAIKNKTKCQDCFWTKEKYEKLDISKMHNYTGPEKIAVFQYSNTGEYECCYDSILTASKVNNMHHSNISVAMKLGTICKNKYFTNNYEINFSVSNQTRIKSTEVHQYTLEGEYVASYKNAEEAKRGANTKSNIYRAIQLGQTAGGFQWSFEKLERMNPVKPKNGRKRKVGKYDKDWNLIEEYPTLAAAKKANGSGLIHVLDGRDQFAKGFRYKYLS